MLKKVIFIAILFFISNSYAQFINPDALRIRTDSSGFAGSVGLDINLIKNTSTIFVLGNSIYVQYRKNKHLIFLINNINLKKINGEDIVNKGTLHLRYNYKINDKFSWEAFVQSHYNSISLIDKRQLAGTGPRFTLYKEKIFDLYLGTLFMYEHEKISEDVVVYNDDIRFSGYVTFRIFPSDNFTFATTTFYQPRVNQLNDFRIYSHNSIMFKVWKKLSLGITFIATYDSFPAQGIPEFQYQLLNGFSYTFN